MIEIKKMTAKHWIATADNGLNLEFHEIMTGLVTTDDNVYVIEATDDSTSKPYVVTSNFGGTKINIGNVRTLKGGMEIAMAAYLKTFQAPKPHNRPKKGDKTTVDPIRKQKDVERIKINIKGNARDYLLFIIGINNGLRAGDLLKIRVRDIQNKKTGEFLRIRESKTGKTNILVINKSIYAALKRYLIDLKPDPTDYLFKSRKGTNNPLTISTINNLVKKWCRDAKIEGNFGAHTLRKTWGYHARMYHGAGFEIICKRYNHSSPAVTMRYLGIEDKEVTDLLMCNI